MEMEERRLAESSSNGRRSKAWKQIWELKIPNVEKNFLWRACHESLPTRHNLFRRNIVEDPSCPICGLAEETALHILWQCSSARDVWCVGPKKLQKSSGSGLEFLQVVEDVFTKCSLEDIDQFAGIARRIWLRRNRVVHEGTFSHPNSLVQQARQASEDFQLAQCTRESQQPSPGDPRLQRWNAPLGGWIKLNTNASVNKDNGWMGYGAVARDERGAVMAAQCRTVKGNLDATLAEAGALLMAIKLCQRMGFHTVHFEGDSQIVVEGINSLNIDWSSKGLMLGDIMEALQGIHCWQISFIHREGNKAAHMLAKLATMVESEKIWINNAPDCIRDIVLIEQHALSS
jgi:ribonuclease HI